MGEKKWYTSKTIWANFLMGLVSILTAIIKDGGIDPKTAGIIGVAVSIVNIVLRMITDAPIEKTST